MHKLPAATVNKIGKHFVDMTDAPMVVEGTITGIVRERKSRSLCFRYYDTTMYSSAPRDKSKYLYIVVKWAISNVKFSTTKSALQALACSVSNEEQLLNNGPGTQVKRKHSRSKSHRNRAPLEWYQQLGKGGEAAVS